MPAERHGFTFCICPDSRLLSEHIDALLQKYPPAGGKTWERHTYRGDEELPPRFWEDLTQQGLFGTSRAIVVRCANAIPAAVWKNISSTLSSPNAQAWPIFCLEVAWEKGQPKVPAHIGKLKCLSFADSKKWVWRAPGLDERTLRSYVQNRAKVLGISFAPGAFESLCAALPPDATAIEPELQKLAVFQGTPVTPEMTATGGYTPEFNIFGFITQLQNGNAAAAWEQIARGKKNDDGLVFSFLGLLAREARILWQLHAGERVRLFPNEAQRKQALSQKLGTAGLMRLFTLVFITEWQIKSGERQPEQALDALVGELTLLFARKNF